MSLFLIAGPCVIESEALVMEVAQALSRVSERLGISIVFKASYDKANRTSVKSFRGPGLSEGLRILERVRRELGLKVITDVHAVAGLDEVAEVVDWIQIPAFLSRQTDLVVAACSYGKPVMIKKAQFMAPWDMQHVVTKARSTGLESVMVCERGTSFGYQNLVVDMRSLVMLRQTGCPVVMDVTHAVQLPGGRGESSAGQRQFVPALARAAVAVGVQGLFLETHPRPNEALSDGPNAWPLDRLEGLLEDLMALDACVQPRIDWEGERGQPMELDL